MDTSKISNENNKYMKKIIIIIICICCAFYVFNHCSRTHVYTQQLHNGETITITIK